MNYRNLSKLSIGLLGFTLFTACSDDDETKQELGGLIPAEEVFGKANDVFTADEWFLVDSSERQRRPATRLPLLLWRM